MPVYMVKKKSQEVKEFNYISGRSYKKYVKENFQYDVQYHPLWESFWLCARDPEMLWDITETIILDCADFHCPNRKMTILQNSPCTTAKFVEWDIFRQQNKFVKRPILEAREDI